MALVKKDSADLSRCSVSFSLPIEAAAHAKDVRVVGDFNNWSWEQGLRMKAGKKAFTAKIDLDRGRRYEFRYLIDQLRWENDWEADDYVSAPFEGIDNSVIDLTATGAATSAAKPAASKTSSTAAKPRKSRAKKRDLTIIEGIGPKIMKLLGEAGIQSFQDLAAAPVPTLEEVLAKAGPRYRMHKPDTWPQQAQLAVAGKWDELATWQKELKGGRAPSKS